MGAHAKFSPSSASRWMACPGSVALTENLPDDDNVYSREGVFAHKIASQLLDGGEIHATKAISVTDGEFTVDAEMAKHIQVYIDYVTRLAIKIDGEVLVEQKVVFDADVWGTADAIVHNGAELHVVDFKYGAGVFVDAAENEQLLIYLEAARRQIRQNRHFDGHYVHIVQPRCYSPDGQKTRVWPVPDGQLEEFAGKVEAAVALARASFELVPGEHCTFCKAKATCPALHERALVAAADVFPTGDPSVVKPPVPVNLTAEQLGRYLPNLPIIEKWIAALRERAEELAKAGRPIPGYKLVERLSNRKWIDDTKAAAELRSWGIDPFETFVISPAKAEAACKAAKNAIATMTTRTSNGVSLVPESDKRPAVDARIADVFL